VLINPRVDKASGSRLWRHLARRARWIALASVLGLLTPIASGWLAASSGTFGWLLDLATHWQWLYLGSLVLAISVLSLGDRRWLLALLAIPLPWMTPSQHAPRLEADQASKQSVLTVASANVHLDNRDPTALARWLIHASPDIVVLHEVSPQYAVSLEGLDGYPYRFAAPRDDPFGMAVLSRLPLTQARLVGGEDEIQHLEATVSWRGENVRLVALHPMPPLTPHDHRVRNERLRALAAGAKASGQPTIIAGDLNATPWSSAFNGLDGMALRRATGLAATWPSVGRGWVGIPIDHVLVSPHWAVADHQIGPHIGSDHLPVMARIALGTGSGI